MILFHFIKKFFSNVQVFGQLMECTNYIKQSHHFKFFSLYSHLYNFNWLNYTVYQNVIHLHFSTHNLFLPVGRTRHSFSMKLLSNKLLVKQKSVCWSIFSNYFCYLFLTIACSYNFLGLLQVFLQIFLCLCTCLSFAHIIYFNDVMFLICML